MSQNRYLNNNRHSKWRVISATFLLAVLILVLLIFINTYAQIPTSSDFLKFYSSIRFLHRDQSIYKPLNLESIPSDIPIDPELVSDFIGPNLNPPFQTLLLSPLGLFSYGYAYWIWSLLSITMGLISVCLIWNAYHEEFPISHVFELSIVFLVFFPTILTIILGQFSAILLFLITIAWISARKGQERNAGITLGVALSLKIFTGLFIPVFIVQRRWKLLIWYIGTFFIVNVISMLIIGLDEHIEYLRTVSSITWYASSWNPSLMGFLSRIFGGFENISIIDAPRIGITLYYIVSILLVSILLWFTKIKDDDIFRFDLIYGLTIVSILIISPLGWIYYYELMILPLVVAWYQSKEVGEKSLRWFLIAAWILFCIPHNRIQGKDLIPIDIFTYAGYPFYGLLLFLITFILLLHRQRIR